MHQIDIGRPQRHPRVQHPQAFVGHRTLPAVAALRPRRPSRASAPGLSGSARSGIGLTKTVQRRDQQAAAAPRSASAAPAPPARHRDPAAQHRHLAGQHRRQADPAQELHRHRNMGRCGPCRQRKLRPSGPTAPATVPSPLLHRPSPVAAPRRSIRARPVIASRGAAWTIRSQPCRSQRVGRSRSAGRDRRRAASASVARRAPRPPAASASQATAAARRASSGSAQRSFNPWPSATSASAAICGAPPQNPSVATAFGPDPRHRGRQGRGPPFGQGGGGKALRFVAVVQIFARDRLHRQTVLKGQHQRRLDAVDDPRRGGQDAARHRLPRRRHCGLKAPAHRPARRRATRTGRGPGIAAAWATAASSRSASRHSRPGGRSCPSPARPRPPPPGARAAACPAPRSRRPAAAGAGSCRPRSPDPDRLREDDPRAPDRPPAHGRPAPVRRPARSCRRARPPRRAAPDPRPRAHSSASVGRPLGVSTDEPAEKLRPAPARTTARTADRARRVQRQHQRAAQGRRQRIQRRMVDGDRPAPRSPAGPCGPRLRLQPCLPPLMRASLTRKAKALASPCSHREGQSSRSDRRT